MTFLEQKRRALERLRIKGADDEVEGILEKLNSFESFFTTSSCSGRIALICVPEIGAKREAEFFGKWHRSVKIAEVLEALNSAEKGEVWLISQSPILHVSCMGLENAKVLLRIAIESGFKYSGIKAISRGDEKVVVEIMSTERMDVPLGKDGVVFCSESYIDFILSKANFMLERGKRKLKRLYYALQKLE
ncbi:tRNA(Phe) 7-((3-amino-3-carboxypropyl)-4-demethylwyosine(37)-N(4))- methyltransferase 1 [ANME-1 cluster archaeon GoMg2]|nr:tRNA(Phe) 7-((3-amino-3-carboxypropyl)-4-demethylwyosine(37)-N(4))- methyltransferase 1 [ANME-1 cluster archaeon GoMg2]